VTEHAALVLLGIFLALSYLASLMGGMAADRGLGSRRAAVLGCILLGLGYAALVANHRELCWAGLLLQAVGHGLFKPGINVAASTLYPIGDPRRDRGFMLMHVSTNVGAMLGPLCSEWSGGQGQPGMFWWAGGSMTVAATALLLGRTCIEQRAHPNRPVAPAPTSGPSDQARSRAILLLCSVGIVFWLTTQQAATALVLFAESHTWANFTLLHRRITLGPGRFASMHCLFVLLLVPVLVAAFSRLATRGREPSAIAKLVSGYLVTAGAFALLGLAGLRGGDTGRVSPAWLSACYVLLSGAEVLLAPMSLSLVTRLAPSRKTAGMVGLWFGATAAGNAAAGAMGLLWGRWPNHRYFSLLAFISLGAAGLLMSRLPQLDRLLRGSDEETAARLDAHKER
jgi:POT family proton-dependent oligopeptide transporter